MRLPDSRRREIRLDAPMTPMIDVIFQLLIFFICTASFQAAEELLPSTILANAAGNQALPELEAPQDLERVVVQIEWEAGRPAWRVNENTCRSAAELNRLIAALAALAAELPVVVDPAPETPLEHVVLTYDLCRANGFDRVQFAASDQP